MEGENVNDAYEDILEIYYEKVYLPYVLGSLSQRSLCLLINIYSMCQEASRLQFTAETVARFSRSA
jgi:hypothetical protein